MKTRHLLYVAAPVLCSGCALFGANADPEAQKHAVQTGCAVVDAVASVTGQGWAIPIVSALSATLVGAINLHHGARNVAVGTATGAWGLAKSLVGKLCSPPPPPAPTA